MQVSCLWIENYELTIFKQKVLGERLHLAIHLLRLELGNVIVWAVSSSAIVCKFGRNEPFKVSHKAGNCMQLVAISGNTNITVAFKKLAASVQSFLILVV